MIAVHGQLDLRRTLAPLGGVFRDDGWWRTARTPEGPATLRLRRGEAGVAVEAWGAGSGWMVTRAPSLIGCDDHPQDLRTEHPLVGRLAHQHAGVRFGATGLVFEALVWAVVGQKVTGVEASRGMKGLESRFSEDAPGSSGLRLPPDPERMAAAPYWDFHSLGIEKRRSDVLRRLASHADGIESLGGLASGEVSARLERHSGVGPWTSAETVAVSHGDADVVSVGDFHLKNLVAWHLTGRPRGTDEEMLATLEPFRPHRGRVIRLLETLCHAPAFGPRRPLRSIADR
ncbi:DNA-3-methyladenine glycosylase [soil metagenome]